MGENLLSDENKNENKAEIIPIKKLSKEELEFQKVISANFSQLAKLIRRDLNDNKQAEYTFYKNFDRDKVQAWLSKPQKHEKQLREVSRFLYVSSSHYKRAVQYFATLPMFKYVIDLYGIVDFDGIDDKVIKKKYLETVNYVDVMNLEHEMSKVSLICWIEDTFFGYEYRLKDSYFIQPLDPNYCQISSIEDGSINFQYNFEYFNSRKEELERVSPEFTEKYNLYLTNKKKYKWQELNSENTICIKLNDNCDYSIPPLSGILESLYDIEDFKQLKKSKTELENYLVLAFSIPYQKNAEDRENAFALSIDKSLEFYEMALSQLPEQCGALLSPFDKIDAIRVDKSDKTVNTVEEAEDAFYNDAGISKMLFNSSANGASLAKSITIDEMIIFKFLKQCERWLNRKLKNYCKKVFFKSHFLEMTWMSRDSHIKNLKDAAMAGVPCKLRYASAIGLSPSAIEHGQYLEGVLGIPDTWKPLNTSYTQSGDGGRPQNDDDNLSPEAEKTRERDDNNPDNRG